MIYFLNNQPFNKISTGPLVISAPTNKITKNIIDLAKVLFDFILILR